MSFTSNYLFNILVYKAFQKYLGFELFNFLSLNEVFKK